MRVKQIGFIDIMDGVLFNISYGMPVLAAINKHAKNNRCSLND
jgi:hypothetical protein